jgi:hypothetical protein
MDKKEEITNFIKEKKVVNIKEFLEKFSRSYQVTLYKLVKEGKIIKEKTDKGMTFKVI